MRVCISKKCISTSSERSERTNNWERSEWANEREEWCVCVWIESIAIVLCIFNERRRKKKNKFIIFSRKCERKKSSWNLMRTTKCNKRWMTWPNAKHENKTVEAAFFSHFYSLIFPVKRKTSANSNLLKATGFTESNKNCFPKKTVKVFRIIWCCLAIDWINH